MLLPVAWSCVEASGENVTPLRLLFSSLSFAWTRDSVSGSNTSDAEESAEETVGSMKMGLGGGSTSWLLGASPRACIIDDCEDGGEHALALLEREEPDERGRCLEDSRLPLIPQVNTYLVLGSRLRKQALQVV